MNTRETPPPTHRLLNTVMWKERRTARSQCTQPQRKHFRKIATQSLRRHSPKATLLRFSPDLIAGEYRTFNRLLIVVAHVAGRHAAFARGIGDKACAKRAGSVGHTVATSTLKTRFPGYPVQVIGLEKTWLTNCGINTMPLHVQRSCPCQE
jgi:hypothetical protein